MKDKGFSNRLKHLREEKDISLRKLSKLTGLSYQRIQHYEHGRSMPSSEAITLIALALDTTGIYLLRGINHKEAESLKDKNKRSQRLGFILSAAAHSVGLKGYDGKRAVSILARYIGGEIDDITAYRLLKHFLDEVHSPDFHHCQSFSSRL